MFTLENFTNGNTELLNDETELEMYRIVREVYSNEDIKKQYFLFSMFLIDHRMNNAIEKGMRTQRSMKTYRFYFRVNGETKEEILSFPYNFKEDDVKKEFERWLRKFADFGYQKTSA